MNKLFLFNLIVTAALIWFACETNKAEGKKGAARQVVVDTIFTNRFLPAGNGFTGGDGTYSILLPDGRTLWIFGDSFIGNVTPDHHRIKTSPTYIRNCFVTFDHDKIITFQQGEPDEFKSMLIPPEVTDGKYSETERWYWPGDALIENGKLNVFVSKFTQANHDDMWAFEFLGTELVEFSLPDLKRLDSYTFPNLDSVHYGHAVLESDSYNYIYGLKNKFPFVARAKHNKIRSAWQFYDGSEWVDDAGKAAPMLKFSGSEQFSVFEWKGKFVMIMQGSDLSRKIYSFTSKTPFGPWENQKEIYETPIPDNCLNCWTYNALAHPQFMEDDLLLVSYNTNSMRMQDHYDNALIYRPRFLRVPMEIIFSE